MHECTLAELKTELRGWIHSDLYLKLQIPGPILCDTLASRKPLHELSLSLGHTLTEISASEQGVCELLAPLLRSSVVGDAIVTTPDEDYVFSSFEFFLPGVLREVHAEWRHESLDGIYPQVFRKTAEREIELLGTADTVEDIFTKVYGFPADCDLEIIEN